MSAPLFTDADVEEVARALAPHLFDVDMTDWAAASQAYTEAQRSVVLSDARDALSLAAPRIVGNVLRDMETVSDDVQVAAYCEFVWPKAKFGEPDDSMKKSAGFSLGLNGSDPDVSWDAKRRFFVTMLTAYARERGVEIGDKEKAPQAD